MIINICGLEDSFIRELLEINRCYHIKCNVETRDELYTRGLLRYIVDGKGMIPSWQMVNWLYGQLEIVGKRR